MSARTGASSKVNSFQTIFGINSGPANFLTVKAPAQIPVREALRTKGSRQTAKKFIKLQF